MIDQPRLAIVGAGPRASEVARALCRLSLIGELVLVDPAEPSHSRIERADLFRLHTPIGPVSVRATGYDALQDVGLVLLVLEHDEADRAGPGDESLIDAVVDALDRHAPGAVVVVASEPSEALVARVQTRSARPPARIFGTGTLPDTLCLRSRVAAHLNVDTDAVDLQVLGWHGSGATPLWSRAQVGGAPLINGTRLNASTRERLTAACRQQWTDDALTSDEDHALGRIVHAVLKDTHAVLPVATCVREEDVFGDSTSTPLSEPTPLAISLPCVVGKGGVERVLLPPIVSDERAALRRNRHRILSLPAVGVPGHAGRRRAT